MTEADGINRKYLEWLLSDVGCTRPNVGQSTVDSVNFLLIIITRDLKGGFRVAEQPRPFWYATNEVNVLLQYYNNNNNYENIIIIIISLN